MDQIELLEEPKKHFPKWLVWLLAVLGILAGAALLSGLFVLSPTGHVSASAPLISILVSATPSRTPFRPLTYTPTFTPSLTPTATATPTATLTPTSTPQPTATATRTPEELPERAYVSGIKGAHQTLGLSCESRAAADWAGFFGTTVRELDFQAALPKSDNPNKGFVGNPDGYGGQIPPKPYGVYAGPVAALLRAYGVPAEDHRDVAWDDVRREIAAGRPVIVWVISGFVAGHPVTYHAQDGEDVVVAPNEHTLMVVGYTPDSVSILDGGARYNVTIGAFLRSWSTLGKQAIFRPEE